MIFNMVVIWIAMVIGTAVGQAVEQAHSHSDNTTVDNHDHPRFRRQLGRCSWGAEAVSGCFQYTTGGYYCGRTPYVCDTSLLTGFRCCLPSGTGGTGVITQRCRDGVTTPAGLCFPGNTCGGGFTCITPENVCCGTGTGTGGTITQRCRDGTLPAGACFTGGQCGNGLTCIQPENLCCQNGGGTGGTTTFTCPNTGGLTGGVPAGRCITGWCPPTHTCTQGWCCLGNGGTTLRCPNNAAAQGTCDAQRPCQDAAFICVQGSCCQLSNMRCNDGVRVPVSGCIAGQCPPQSQAGRQLRCEAPNNFCCEI